MENHCYVFCCIQNKIPLFAGELRFMRKNDYLQFIVMFFIQYLLIIPIQVSVLRQWYK